MTQEQQQVRDWMLSVGQSCPSKPTIPSLEVRKLRAKLILEEALETIVNGLGITEVFSNELQEGLNLSTFLKTLKEFEQDYLSNGAEPNLLQIADGCEDLKVVTEGTLVACGLLNHGYYDGIGSVIQGYGEGSVDSWIGSDPLFSEVMRSNFSKFYTVDQFTLAVSYHHSDPNWLPHTVYTDDTKQTIKYIVVKDASGKVMKGPSFQPPNLQPIIDEMSK